MSWDHESYRLFKANRICPRCKGEPESDLVHCRKCLDAASARMANHPSPRRAEVVRRAKRKYVTKRYAMRMAAGQCADCGKPWTGPRVRCPKCRREMAARQRRPGARPAHCGLCGQVGHNRRTCALLEALQRAERQARLLEVAGGRRAA